MTETPGLELLASQRRMWDRAAFAAALLSVTVIVICAVHAHHWRVPGAVVLLLTCAIVSGLMAVSGARRVQRFAQNGVPVGDWTHRTGRLGRTRAVSALQTSSPARVLLAVLVGVAVGWVLDLALGEGPSVWHLLPLAAFLLMITVTAQTGLARGAVRLAAGLDATRIPAVALADVSPENSLTPGGLLREQATLRYGPQLVAAALGQCSSYRGTVLDLMEELASTVRGDALQLRVLGALET